MVGIKGGSARARISGLSWCAALCVPNSHNVRVAAAMRGGRPDPQAAEKRQTRRINNDDDDVGDAAHKNAERRMV